MAAKLQYVRNIDQVLDHKRINFSLKSLLLLIYLPVGLVLLLFRLCLIPQALIVLLIVPNGVIKRFLLWVFFSVMGLVVLNKNLNRRSSKVHSSINGRKPLLSWFFSHLTFPSSNPKDITNKLKEISPEFSDDVSIPDTITTPLIAQPEYQPTNGRGLLKFNLWPFSTGKTVQPLAVSSWRPLDISLNTYKSSELGDLLWTFFCPVTFFMTEILPVVDPRDDSTEQFANKTHKQLSTALSVPQYDYTDDDIETWKTNIQRKQQLSLSSPNVIKSNVASGPIILESDFNKVKATSEVERMVQQVLAVFPDAPQHVIRKDLLETRSVDITLTKFLDGRIADSPTDSLPTPPKTSYSLQDCHNVYLMRKQQLIEEARRRYQARHGMLS